ncbi:hypothetical protein [Nocardioides soli]|uniref:Uncharacterized protein n=1 Tax=Nocardioides soli TaxID=1036020 RepID=A0A7W4VYQ1_9ACTN|nr:hypothetical protein [Nocardioides soli]MBB3043963.1 hypothetical protein [Nocardioides soli]
MNQNRAARASDPSVGMANGSGSPISEKKVASSGGMTRPSRAQTTFSP